MMEGISCLYRSLLWPKISEGKNVLKANIAGCVNRCTTAKNSKLELDRAVITTRGDKALATVIVADEEGSYLEGVNIIASCYQCIGVEIDEFIYQGQGRYTADITSTAWLSNGWVEVVVSNQFGSVTPAPKRLVVKLKRTGGCSIVSGERSDISLFLFLFLFTLYNYLKRRHH